MSIQTIPRVGDLLCMYSGETSTTSPKPLTDKPDRKQTNCKDKQRSQDQVPDPSRQDRLIYGVGIQSHGPYHTI